MAGPAGAIALTEAFETLPLLYARWIGELLGAGIPRERKATCGTCAMCRPADAAPHTEDHYFEPSAKCCTYLPRLPNFLAGGVLADPAAGPGQASVLSRIETRAGVTPLGLSIPARYSVLYNAGDDLFGRARGLICPHFVAETADCGVWRHRNSVCATWFCKHERGRLGLRFWRGALQPLLETLEAALAKWCVLELDLDVAALEALADSAAWDGGEGRLTAAEIDGAPDPKAYARLWGRWLGREAECFERCAELVAGLSWPEVLAIGGPNARARAMLTAEAFRRLVDPATPERLRPAPVQVARAGAGHVRLVSYSAYDPLEAPAVTLALLPAFDGRPTAEVIAEVEAATGLSVEPGFVRKLADFGVLTPEE